MRKLLFISLITLATSASAIDISPYTDGQILTEVQAKKLQTRYKQREQQAWKKVGDMDAIKKHNKADLLSYAVQVLDKTAITIGPDVADKNKRFSGNHLNCSSCHLKGDTQLPGTKYDSLPFANVSNDYPQFRGRNMSVVTAAARVNGCMTRSMGAGTPLALESKEMKAILAYFDWLAEGTKKDLAMEGTGLPKITFPDREADVVAGKKVYQQSCTACHGEKALGTKAPDHAQTGSYLFPPISGEDSFNDGAGMSRLMKATRFIRANMPLGVSSETPVLSIEQAYDVAAYVLSLPRAAKANREEDFPNVDFRPADYPVPAFFKGDPAGLKKAKLGSYR